MSRVARKGYDASFFHVMCQGINRERIFEEDSFKNKYLSLMKQNSKDVNLHVIAYCIMSNHVHILVNTSQIFELSKYMKAINTQFAQYFNYEKERVGFVFRDRFKSQPINSMRYLYQCINYIHLNPVKAGMVQKCEEYNFSSYRDYINNTGIVKKEIFKELFDEDIMKTLKNVARCSDFLDEMCEIDVIINEYIVNYLNDNGIKLETIFINKIFMNELVKILLQSPHINKHDIQTKLGISWKTVNSIVEES